QIGDVDDARGFLVVGERRGRSLPDVSKACEIMVQHFAHDSACGVELKNLSVVCGSADVFLKHDVSVGGDGEVVKHVDLFAADDGSIQHQVDRAAEVRVAQV